MDWKNKFEKFKKEEKTSKLPENANNSTVVRLENHSKVDKPEPKSFSNDKVREGFCKNLLSILKYEQASQGLDEEEVLLRNLVIEIEEGNRHFFKKLVFWLELFKKNKEVTANYREDARTLCSNLKVYKFLINKKSLNFISFQIIMTLE